MNSRLRILTVVMLATMVIFSFGQEEDLSLDLLDTEEAILDDEGLAAVDELVIDEAELIASEELLDEADDLAVEELPLLEEDTGLDEEDATIGDQLLPPALIEGDVMELDDLEDVPAELGEDDLLSDLVELEDLVEDEGALPEDDLETELIELEMDQTLDETVASVETEARDLITISLDDVPVQDVVRMFTRISGVNIVAGTNLQGNVTVSLQEVEWEPALRVILDSVDMTMVEKTPGIYSILSKAEMASEPVTVDTIFLSFVTTKDVLPVVKKMIVSTNGSASGYKAANAVIVQETAEQLGRIKKTVEKLDVPRKQVFIEAKFVELNDQAIKNLGVNWSVLENYTVTASALGGSYGQSRSTARGTTASSGRSWSRNWIATDSDVDTITEAESELDSSGSNSGTWNTFSIVNGIPSIGFQESDFSGQVSGSNVSGVDDGGLDAVPVYERERVRTLSEVGTAESEEYMSRSVVDDVLTTTEQAFGAVLSADVFALTLSALKQDSGVDVISNPRIIVASGEEAEIHVGIEEPNVQAKPQGDSGNTYVYGLDDNVPFHSVGVKVKVLPTVNTEDRITLKIDPELSRLLTSVTVPQAGISFPRISTRRISTEFNLESGRTVAIAGLTTSTDSEQITKVPLLGDIPVIGKYFFRHTSTEVEQDELVIFVTVGLASAETLTEVAGVPSGGRLIHRHLAKEAMQAQRIQTGP